MATWGTIFGRLVDAGVSESTARMTASFMTTTGERGHFWRRLLITDGPEKLYRANKDWRLIAELHQLASEVLHESRETDSNDL